MDAGSGGHMLFWNIIPGQPTGNFWHKDIYPNQVWLDGPLHGYAFLRKMPGGKR